MAPATGPLTAAEVKQIAGRAGRFGSSYGRGGVTCMHQVCSADSSLALQSMHSVRRYAELMCIRPALAGCIEIFLTCCQVLIENL